MKNAHGQRGCSFLHALFNGLENSKQRISRPIHAISNAPLTRQKKHGQLGAITCKHPKLTVCALSSLPFQNSENYFARSVDRCFGTLHAEIAPIKAHPARIRDSQRAKLLGRNRSPEDMKRNSDETVSSGRRCFMQSIFLSLL